MHQTSPFWAQKSKNFLGRGLYPLPRPLPRWGWGHPVPTPHPSWGWGHPIPTPHPPRRLRLRRLGCRGDCHGSYRVLATPLLKSVTQTNAENASLFYHLVSFPSRTVRLLIRHSWLKTGLPCTNCSEFIGKSEWPPNSLDVNPLDYHIWWVIPEHYKTFYPKPKNTLVDWRKSCTWSQLPQDSINMAIVSFTKTYWACMCERWDRHRHLTCALRKTV